MPCSDDHGISLLQIKLVTPFADYRPGEDTDIAVLVDADKNNYVFRPATIVSFDIGTAGRIDIALKFRDNGDPAKIWQGVAMAGTRYGELAAVSPEAGAAINFQGG